jgi:hypothetical protein
MGIQCNRWIGNDRISTHLGEKWQNQPQLPILPCKTLKILHNIKVWSFMYRVLHSIKPMGIHFLRCAHGNKCMRSHDAVCDTFVIIVWDVGLHVEQKQLQVFILVTLNCFHRQVNIVFTKDEIRTLINVVIINPMHAYLLPWSCTTQRFVASNANQVKERSY